MLSTQKFVNQSSFDGGFPSDNPGEERLYILTSFRTAELNGQR